MQLITLFFASFIVTTLGQPDILNFKTEFFLYTRGRSAQVLEAENPDSISSSSFDPCRKTVFLMTGYFQPRGDLRLITFAETLAERSFNAILMEYFTFGYFFSPVLGGINLARFMQTLVAVTGADPRHITLMGISMGTHTAAYASRRFRVGHIIALDPSGPIYELLPRFFRVDKSDADFVEAVHSSLIAGSINLHVGHVNYVINGAVSQPGCRDEMCNHLRSAYLYLSTIDKCVIHFRQCASFLAMVLGLCRENPTLLFGFPLDPETAPRSGHLYHYLTDRENPQTGANHLIPLTSAPAAAVALNKV